MLKKLLFVMASASIVSCKGQTENKQIKGTGTKANLDIVYADCPKADITEVENNADGYTEVEYLCNGRRYEMGIKQNKIFYKELALEQSEIPYDKINRKLEKKYQGWTLDEVTQITMNDTSFLKVEIIKDGIEQNLYFTNDGKWYKIKPIDLTASFDMNTIAQNSTYTLTKYNFHKPDSIYEMPDLLKEISGITIADNKTVYCIQDEIGSIFEYDTKNKDIVKSQRFTDIGDFEDLTINKNIIYILRSDGNLFMFDQKNQSKTQQFMLPINSLNIEGICFNDNYLYIACKDALVNQNETKRSIYRVKTDKLNNPEPFLEIRIDDLKTFLNKNYPESGITDIQFNPSAIAIHPITNELYVLSASDRLLAIFKNKTLINVIPLSAELYYKPEGLAFYKSGDLLISSEGDKKGFIKGSINLIKYRN